VAASGFEVEKESEEPLKDQHEQKPAGADEPNEEDQEAASAVKEDAVGFLQGDDNGKHEGDNKLLILLEEAPIGIHMEQQLLEQAAEQLSDDIVEEDREEEKIADEPTQEAMVVHFFIGDADEVVDPAYAREYPTIEHGLSIKAANKKFGTCQ